jgi:SAM-dependent methyltransferase
MVEIDDQAVAFARDELGLRSILQADVQAVVEHEAGPFDLVLGRHVIEHLREPDSFVANLANLTAPGGVLVLETPNADNWEQWAHPAMFSQRWRTMSRENPDLSAGRRLTKSLAKPLSAATPPKHLWGFRERHLRVLLARHGFAVRKTVTTVAGDPVFDPLYYHASRRDRPRDRVYRLYERATSPLIRALGKGSLLVVFAQQTASSK